MPNNKLSNSSQALMTTISSQQFKDRFKAHAGQKEANGPLSKGFAGIDSVKKQEVFVKTVEKGMNLWKPLGWWDARKIGKLGHSNLVQPASHFEIVPDKGAIDDIPMIAYVMQYFSDGNLGDAIKEGIFDSDKPRLIEGIMNGLDALHQRGLIHGNLKPENVLIEKVGHLHPRLSDFGKSQKQFFEAMDANLPAGYIRYFAPEQLEPLQFARGKKLRQNVDYWALGMLVYEIFRSKPFFEEENAIQNGRIASKITAGDLPSDLDQLPKNYAELVRACLTREADQRPSRIDSLRRIVDGEIIWRNGRAEDAPDPEPIPICCKECGVENEEGRVICRSCGKALFGPEFLRNFKSSRKVGFWAASLFTLFLLPLAFFYYGFYVKCEFKEGFCDAKVYIKSVEKVMDNDSHLKANWKNLDKEEKILVGLFAVLQAVGLSATTMFLFWTFRVSGNLARLGSRGRVFHPAYLALSSVLMIVCGVLAIVMKNPLLLILVILLGIIPLLTLQEIWRGSNPSYLVQGEGWKNSKSSFVIFSWWLLGLLFPVLIFLPFLPTTLKGEIQIEWYISAVSLVALYWFLSIMLIVRINYRQHSKYMGWVRESASV